MEHTQRTIAEENERRRVKAICADAFEMSITGLMDEIRRSTEAIAELQASLLLLGPNIEHVLWPDFPHIDSTRH